MTLTYRHRGLGSTPRKIQVHSLFLPQNWCLEAIGEGDNEVICRGHQLFFLKSGKLRVWKVVADLCWWTVADRW